MAALLPSDILLSGSGGNVVCLYRKTGEELWRTNLSSTGFVTLLTDQTMIFAQCNGVLHALRYADGAILWRNKLPGCGYGIGSLAFASGQQNGPLPLATAAAAAEQEEEEARRRRQ